MRSIHAFFLGFVVLALVGCGDGTTVPGSDSGPSIDAAGSDGGGRDAAGSDTGVGDVDTGVVAPDAGTIDDAGSALDAASDLDAAGGPSCTITAPVSGAAYDYDAMITFVATASDPEDGALSGASVVWRSDRVTTPLGSGLSLSTTLAPGVHTIRCIATDSTGNSGSSTITVTSRSPLAAIFHPGDGEVRAAGSAIPFVGRGRDFEDGMLTGASLVWTSSLDGMLGTGTMFNAPLSAGTNVVTLTVTDSAGNTGSTSITLTITP